MSALLEPGRSPRMDVPGLDLCPDLALAVLALLPARDRCAFMATCHAHQDHQRLRAAVGAAKRAHRRTASRRARRRAARAAHDEARAGGPE